MLTNDKDSTSQKTNPHESVQTTEPVLENAVKTNKAAAESSKPGGAVEHGLSRKAITMVKMTTRNHSL